MGNLDKIPDIGWGVIALIAVLIFIVLIVLLRRGAVLGWGDKKIALGRVDKKLDSFKAEFEEQNKKRLEDEEQRKALFRKAGEIDEKLKADERRVIRRLYEPIKTIFKSNVKCEMPYITAAEIIKDELLERIDYNNLKEKLTSKERRGYIQDILFNIETDYKAFLLKIPRLPCGSENYPSWSDIKPDLEKLVNAWSDSMIEAINGRINEKIEMYESERDKFILPEYKTLCIDSPIKKNEKYLKNLGKTKEEKML